MVIDCAEHREHVKALQQRAERRRLALDLPESSTSAPIQARSLDPRPSTDQAEHPNRTLTADQQAKLKAYGPDYVPAEETVRSDFSLQYVNTGRRPQNFLLGCDLERRFDEYPKLRRLLDLHADLVDAYACPPTYLQLDPERISDSLRPLIDANAKFDCIVIDPPNSVSWDALETLPIPHLSAMPSFIWLWCGAGNTNGLERGRDLLIKWGYRRSEDIVWIKPNSSAILNNDLLAVNEERSYSIFHQSKEHCLMGIRGTVRRSTDSHFVHCNVDVDVIVWQPDEADPNAKPPELFNIVENLCLGNRRLHLFGSSKKARRGWLTSGLEALDQGSEVHVYDPEFYGRYADPQQGGALTIPNTPEIDALRPRSPPGRAVNQSGGGIGRGRGFTASAPSAGSGATHQLPPRMNSQQSQVSQNPAMSMGMMNPSMNLMFNPGFNPMMMGMMPNMGMMPGMGMMPPNMNMMPQPGMMQPMDWTTFFANQQ